MALPEAEYQLVSAFVHTPGSCFPFCCFFTLGHCSSQASLFLLLMLFLFNPALLLQLIVVWPYLMEFWVASCCLNVGLLFCPLQDRTWQKWFSTQSWLIMAGLITDCGNFLSLYAVMARNPRIMDCMSNHNLDDRKWSFFSIVSCLHSFMNSYR